MVQCEQLVSLIERAGGLIASADKRDAESLDALSEVIEQIQRMLEAVERSQALWDEQIEKATVETLEGLKQVMQQETQNVNHLQVVLQQATQGLMALADQGGIGEAEGETPTEQTDVEPEALCIPEEDVPLVQDFINESSEHIEAAEIGLLELEKAPEDKEVINRIFRAFHTIKGMAGFLNLHDIGSLAHSAEKPVGHGPQGGVDPAGIQHGYHLRVHGCDEEDDCHAQGLCPGGPAHCRSNRIGGPVGTIEGGSRTGGGTQGGSRPTGFCLE